MKIPRLLSEATIDAIHQKSEANKTYTHVIILQLITKKLRATETNLNKMKWEDKRKLVQAIFSEKDINGNRAGVYVRKNDKGVLEYELRGDLLNDTIVGLIPMPSVEYKELLNIFEPEYDLAEGDFIKKKR